MFNKKFFLTAKTNYNNQTVVNYQAYNLFYTPTNLFLQKKSQVLLKFLFKKQQKIYLQGISLWNAPVVNYLHQIYPNYFLSPNWYNGWFDNFLALRQYLTYERSFSDLFFTKFRKTNWFLLKAQALLYLSVPNTPSLKNELTRCRFLSFEDPTLQYLGFSYPYLMNSIYKFFFSFYHLYFLTLRFRGKKKKKRVSVYKIKKKVISIKKVRKKIFFYFPDACI